MIARDAFATALAFTKGEEGGYTDRPEDAGNWTSGTVDVGRLIGSKYGVSAPVLMTWLGIDAPDAIDAGVMRDLDETTYEAIAHALYWRPLSGDMLAAPVALMMFDFGWNTGIGCAGRVLQRTLGMTAGGIDGDVGTRTISRAATPDWPGALGALTRADTATLQSLCGVKPDGVAGPATRAALAARPDLWPWALVTLLGAAQAATYRRMRNFATFGAGWEARTARRAAAARALARG